MVTRSGKTYYDAVRLRTEGLSYREIEQKLDVARSTLSGWLKNVKISEEQKVILHKKWLDGLVLARKLASIAHREAKKERIKKITESMSEYLKDIVLDERMLEIFLSGLYLGDGFKSNGRLGFGNADPKLVVMFLQLLRLLYPLDESKIKLQLFVRADQNVGKVEKYWSQLLGIGRERFHKTQVDKRATKQTRAGYWGVCSIVYPNTALQTRILAIGQEMIKYVGNLQKGS